MTGDSGKARFNTMDGFAETVSNVFHPFVIVIPTMLIAMIRHGNSAAEAVFWTALSICIVLLPLTFVIYVGVRSGQYSDAAISIREQRRTLYLLAALLMAGLIVVLILGKAPIILTACLVAAILATLVGFLINSQITKLSLHSIGMAGCATVLMLLIPIMGIAVALFMPLVAWARIRLKHHTPAQILVGWLDAAISVLIVFNALQLP